MRNKSKFPTMPITANSIGSKIEEIQSAINSLEALIEKFYNHPDHLVAEEYNPEIFEAVCELREVLWYLNNSQISKAA
ncbi:hypothetical protein [Sphingobacterium alimentarium]|nr:hypothetical protein [Sphingobacterium alimentarium]